MANDVPLLCRAVPSSVNVALRSLVSVLGLGGFMVGLSPRLALLALLEVPLIITARKVYDARHQVTVGTGWAGGDGTGWDSGDQGGGMGGMEMMRTVGKGWWGRDGGMREVGTGWDSGVGMVTRNMGWWEQDGMGEWGQDGMGGMEMVAMEMVGMRQDSGMGMGWDGGDRRGTRGTGWWEWGWDDGDRMVGMGTGWSGSVRMER